MPLGCAAAYGCPLTGAAYYGCPGCHPAPASARVAPPAPRRALWALREGRRRPRQKARRPGGSARGVRGQGRELPGPRHGCNGRQGAMGDAGGRREGPRTAVGPQIGPPRRAAANPCPAACRARRPPSGSRAPCGLEGRSARRSGAWARGRRRGLRADRDSPTRFLQKAPFILIYHAALLKSFVTAQPQATRVG